MEVYMASIDFYIDRTLSQSQFDIVVNKITTLGLPGTSCMQRLLDCLLHDFKGCIDVILVAIARHIHIMFSARSP